MLFIFIVLNTFLIQNIYADILFYYETAVLSAINAKKTKAINSIASYADTGQIVPTLQAYIDAGVNGVIKPLTTYINFYYI